MGGTTGFQNVGKWCVQIAARKDGNARLYALPTTTPGVYAALVARTDGPHALVAPLKEDELLALADSSLSEDHLRAGIPVRESFAEFPRASDVDQALHRRGLQLAEPDRLPDAVERRCRRAVVEF